MGNRFRRLPSPAMAVAFIALLAALGGTAVALPGKSGVKKDDIAKGAVNTADIANNTIRTQDIRTGAVRGSDVAANTLTGSDVAESTFGTVPTANTANSANTANTANSANTANTANSVSSLRTIDVATVAEGGAPVTLATADPFTLTGTCTAAAANTVAQLRIATTENNGVVNGLTFEDDDFDIAQGAFIIDDETDAAGGTPNGGSYDSTLDALGPSGRGLTGLIQLFSNASAGASGECQFHGNVVISG